MWRPGFIVGGSDEHLGIGERELGLHLNVEENPLTSTSIQYARVSFITYKDLLLLISIGHRTLGSNYTTSTIFSAPRFRYVGSYS
jgi:hypothetical protein